MTLRLWHWGTWRCHSLINGSEFGGLGVKRPNSLEFEVLVSEQMEMLRCELESRYRPQRTGGKDLGVIGV